MPEPDSSRALHRVAFFLVPDFPLLGFSAAVEPLRAANRLLGRDCYEWRLCSLGGDPVPASNGIEVMPHEAARPSAWPDLVLACAGIGAHEYRERAGLAFLREQARRGTALGGISTGSHLLARAGLLEGRRCTVHWENIPSLREEFRQLEVTDGLYEIDGERYTCSGGTAALDMMLHIIAREHGPRFGAAVSSQFIHDRLRSSGDHQRMAERSRARINSPKLAGAMAIMAENLESPVSPAEIARRMGISTRQLERLFRKYCDCSPQRYYLELRLDHARQLLLQTGMSILSAALASGFVSQSYFTKCYRERFGRTPTHERSARA